MPKLSPLSELHRANGASFTEENGWTLPLHFGAPQKEYEAVRSAVGLLDLSHRGVLRFTGPDRVSFLQGMVSNDVKAMASGEGAYAAFLDIQGKVLADARVFLIGESFFLDLWEFLKEKILKHLNRYLIADEVEIEDLSGQYALLSLQGPKAEILIRETFPRCEIPVKNFHHRPVQYADQEIHLIRSTHSGEDGFDLLMRTEDLNSVALCIQENGKPFSLRWIGLEAQETLRVEAGIPRYGVDMDEETLLLETGLDHAVSFTKGCYLGQEVVERIRSRGHVNRKLAGMILKGDRVAQRGSLVRAGEKEIGRVTSSVFSPARKSPVALGYLHRDFLQAGTQVSIHWNDNVIQAGVCGLPFYQASA